MKSNFLLLTTAAIWGLAIVAQRAGMDYIGPFAFNAIRFALGGLSLVPLMLYERTARAPQAADNHWADTLKAGMLAGFVLFMGASLQQVGLVYTTAGKAAFITCLYIVLVPLAGVFLRQKTTGSTWIGALLAVAGLYLLCITESLSLAYGDLLELIGAAFWTMHILMIDRFAAKVRWLHLAFVQVMTCAALSTAVAAATESVSFAAAGQAAIPLLYGGVCSVGIAYTLQIIGQKNAEPAHAAIILSLETVFAVLGGWLILNEQLGVREVTGCVLMMTGMLLPQVYGLISSNKEASSARG